jgi:tetratricopeptide (TPR) repeat protein
LLRDVRRSGARTLDFSKQIQKADEAARKRNFDFAIQLYQQILEIQPDEGEARAGLRQALKKRHELKKGGSAFLRTLTGAAPLAMAKTLHKAKKFGPCVKALETYLTTNPLDEEANLLLGQALEDGEHFNSARAVYEFLAEIAPKNPEALKRAGAMTYRLGDHARALEYYERALAADPRDQQAIKARKDLAAERALTQSTAGNVQHSRDQIKDKDAARDLERSQRMHHSDDELREELARLEARYADSPDPELMIRMADVHEKLKDFESALQWIERAQGYRKDSYDLVCHAGDLRAKVMKKEIARAGKAGDNERANQLEHELWTFEVEDLKRRVALRPGDLSLRLQLGKRLVRTGELDQAMSELQKAMGDPRAKREAQVLLAQCFQGKGYLDLARKEYQRALESGIGVDERAKEILYNLGAIAEAENNAAEARAAYARIFEVDIGYRDVADKMEKLR